MNIWDCYKLGVQIYAGQPKSLKDKLRLLLRIAHQPTNLARLLTPIDYVRYREFDFVLKAIHRYNPLSNNVLDIGSPKLLPLTLASHIPNSQIHSIDVLESEIQVVESAAEKLDITNIKPEIQDARVLGYPENRFDLVTSVSAFEHIAPERNGELLAARELGRVMATGGIAIITVPFARSYFAEYRIGKVYERISRKGEPIFFQRFYDYELLQKNIILAAGLEILYIGFIEERFFSKDPHKRLAFFINSSLKQNLIFGPWFPLLSRIFLSSPRPLEQCQKPYIACLVLRKPY